MAGSRTNAVAAAQPRVPGGTSQGGRYTHKPVAEPSGAFTGSLKPATEGPPELSDVEEFQAGADGPVIAFGRAPGGEWQTRPPTPIQVFAHQMEMAADPFYWERGGWQDHGVEMWGAPIVVDMLNSGEVLPPEAADRQKVTVGGARAAFLALTRTESETHDITPNASGGYEPLLDTRTRRMHSLTAHMARSRAAGHVLGQLAECPESSYEQRWLGADPVSAKAQAYLSATAARKALSYPQDGMSPFLQMQDWGTPPVDGDGVFGDLFLGHRFHGPDGDLLFKLLKHQLVLAPGEEGHTEHVSAIGVILDDPDLRWGDWYTENIYNPEWAGATDPALLAYWASMHDRDIRAETTAWANSAWASQANGAPPDGSLGAQRQTRLATMLNLGFQRLADENPAESLPDAAYMRVLSVWLDLLEGNPAAAADQQHLASGQWMRRPRPAAEAAAVIRNAVMSSRVDPALRSRFSRVTAGFYERLEAIGRVGD